MLNQMFRHIKVADGHQRFDAIVTAFVNDIFVEAQSILVRGRLVALGENPRPADRKAVHPKAHFREQRDILLVMMVVINRAAGGEAGIAQRMWVERPVSNCAAVLPCGEEIDVRQPAPTLPVSALALIGSGRAAP